MKKRYAILVFSIMCYGNSIAQSARTSTGIQANFNEKSIEAYQESSIDKLSEFYQYLSLYSEKKSGAELKKQLQDNIISLFKEGNILIYDFTSRDKKPISLNLLLSKIENKSYNFTLKPPYNSKDVGLNNWVNQYNIEISNADTEYNFTVNQKIYFSPDYKSFGENSKVVWDIKLGEILP